MTKNLVLDKILIPFLCFMTFPFATLYLVWKEKISIVRGVAALFVFSLMVFWVYCVFNDFFEIDFTFFVHVMWMIIIGSILSSCQFVFFVDKQFEDFSFFSNKKVLNFKKILFFLFYAYLYFFVIAIWFIFYAKGLGLDLDKVGLYGFLRDNRFELFCFVFLVFFNLFFFFSDFWGSQKVGKGNGVK